MGTFPNKDTQFKPGKSGNPEGRPKGSISIPRLLDKLLDGEVKLKETGEKITKREAMVLRIIEKAYNGDITAFKEIVDRLEGKARQFIEQKNTNFVQFKEKYNPTSATDLVKNE